MRRRSFLQGTLAGIFTSACGASSPSPPGTPPAVSPGASSAPPPLASAAPEAPAASPLGPRFVPAVTLTAPASPVTPAPLPDVERTERLARAARIVAGASADALVVSSGTSTFTYLTGVRAGRSERLLALAVPARGAPFIVLPSFERERFAPTLGALELVPWEEHESPYARLAARVPRARRVLVEPHVEYGVAASLASAWPGARLADGSAETERLRLRKTPYEMARLREAIALTEDVFRRVVWDTKEGETEREISARVARAFEERGVSGYALVQVDATSALPHASPGARAVRRGSVLLLDGGCTVAGYWSDITRTYVFGDEAPADFVRVYNLVHDAQSAALARAKPGVPLEELDAVARKVISAAGHGEHFTHRLGHGIGLDGHEAPYLVKGNGARLEEGSVFTIEPGVYLPGRFGVRLEDDVVCTAQGAELLSERAPRLADP